MGSPQCLCVVAAPGGASFIGGGPLNSGRAGQGRHPHKAGLQVHRRMRAGRRPHRRTLATGLLAEGWRGSWETPATRMGQGLGLRTPPQASPSSLLPWRPGGRGCELRRERERPAGCPRLSSAVLGRPSIRHRRRRHRSRRRSGPRRWPLRGRDGSESQSLPFPRARAWTSATESQDKRRPSARGAVFPPRTGPARARRPERGSRPEGARARARGAGRPTNQSTPPAPGPPIRELPGPAHQRGGCPPSLCRMSWALVSLQRGLSSAGNFRWLQTRGAAGPALFLPFQMLGSWSSRRSLSFFTESRGKENFPS